MEKSRGGTPMTTWRPIPGFEGAYSISPAAQVRSEHRVIIRRNGSPYTCQPRILRLKPHMPSGRLMVTLSRGRRGDPRYAYVHKLLQATFGEEVNAA
jgi:hypothetical protein